MRFSTGELRIATEEIEEWNKGIPPFAYIFKQEHHDIL
jgi:hypothetical protein